MKVSTLVLQNAGVLEKVLDIKKFPYPSIEISDDALIEITDEDVKKLGGVLLPVVVCEHGAEETQCTRRGCWNAKRYIRDIKDV